ncbi:hypothetical protein E6O75_ATG08074 [Venturia nashicola]|uniref:Secreted protein n=1 Tax=Venturia nashicola TaxID=86259 RepID=A0A4Z1NV44_9PEZI|nr:hypothetical protein E6O75_ATG08074 [Venturia nashicola]
MQLQALLPAILFAQCSFAYNCCVQMYSTHIQGIGTLITGVTAVLNNQDWSELCRVETGHLRPYVPKPPAYSTFRCGRGLRLPGPLEAPPGFRLSCALEALGIHFNVSMGSYENQ